MYIIGRIWILTREWSFFGRFSPFLKNLASQAPWTKKSYLNFAVDGDWSVKSTVHSQNSGLRWVNDRSSKEWSKNASIRNGESATLHIFNTELTGTGQASEAGELALNLENQN